MARYRLMPDVDLPAMVCTADHLADLFSATLHQLENGYRVKFATSGTIPSGITAATIVFVVSKSEVSWQVAATLGGSAIAFSTNGTGTLSFTRVVANVFDTQTNAQIVEDASSPQWLEYLAWKALGNTPDAISSVAIGTTRSNAIADVNLRAAAQRARWMLPDTGASLWFERRLKEAELANVDGSISAGEYPLLEAEVGLNGASVAAVATNVLAEWATLRTKLAGIETARRTAMNAINASSDPVAIAAIPPAITWP